jgi:hypothetical protein
MPAPTSVEKSAVYTEGMFTQKRRTFPLARPETANLIPKAERNPLIIQLLEGPQ